MKNKCYLLKFKLVTQKQGMVDYQKALNDYKRKLNSDQVASSEIIQDLKLGNEPNAKVSYQIDNNGVTVDQLKTDGTTSLFHDLGADDKNVTAGEIAIGKAGYLYVHIPGNINGNVVTVTYDNLQNSSYKGQKIAKIVATIHDVQVDGFDQHRLVISDNPYYGFYQQRLKQFAVNYTYYDANGQMINFSNNEDDGGAWLSIGSLNSGYYRTEEAQLLSSGKAYGFYNSTVAVHGDNTIYSSDVNELTGDLKIDGPTGRGVTTPSPFLNNDNKWWDTPAGLEDPNAYLGAGVFNIKGNHADINFIDETNVNGYMSWFTASTIIPKDSFKITPPSTDVHYHYDVNDKCKEKPNGVTTYQSESK